ncbi:helix-hairpin-helix domain-containing protein [Streptomyces griseus]|uniref:Helix-hairpin-helix domain-containing protein n=1 Tax=Streptomyces stephensoniae TaxID=3375367 RepID=A0ABU2W887_9ACTN|nr:helix-hairpin-helix domain-containing protein [Streptomyces griseus]MDT0493693.1 helix-hairpin-helix domain-containing protein [Streptomyces griseus]
MTPSPASRRRTRAILRIHFHPAERTDDLYGQLLTVVDGISSRVEPLPADWSAYVDLTGALSYWGRDTEGLVAVLRLRLLALHGVRCSAGAGPTRSIAAMAADATQPGAATVVRDDPYEIAAFLRTKPASALPGIGPKTARTLARYGINTVGDIADTRLTTLQRILGAAAARQAHDRACGLDERPVVPGVAPKSLSAGYRFDHDELDPERHHSTVLGLAEEVGGRLRASGEIAQALTLTVAYADRTQTTRTRTLTEATAHSPALAATTRKLLTGLGLQRARVRTLTLRAERLLPAEEAVHQLTLDSRDDKLHRLEAALDKAATRYRPGIAGAAAAFYRAGEDDRRSGRTASRGPRTVGYQSW